MKRHDLVVLNGTAVLPGSGAVRADLGVREGRIATIADRLEAADGEEAVDARGLHILPGAVDSHFHVGIYRPHAEDARSESLSAISGGVTTILSYFRTGHHYLNKTGPYGEIYPEVLALSAGNFWCDYGYHIAPMTAAHLAEIGWLIGQGVSCFKFYMFYKALTLAGDSRRGSEYTMAEDYDLGHLHDIMECVSGYARRAGRRISVSLHCENPEIIRVFMNRVRERGPGGLEGFSAGRPPLSEEVSIEEAGVLARHTGCPINLLHLSSQAAIEAAVDLRRRLPANDIALETTLHHLALTYDDAGGNLGKVNPPIRSAEDREALWRALLAGEVDTVVSDHACCMEEWKQPRNPDIWQPLPGFGGTALLYPVLLSEGVRRRGLPLERAVELAAGNPARKFGLYPKKGAIAIGSDADLALCDLEKTRTVTPEVLCSAQDHSPFAGRSYTGWPVRTILRGRVVFEGGRPVGMPGGAVCGPFASHSHSK